MSFDMGQAQRNLQNTMQNSLNQVQQQPTPRPPQPGGGMGQAPPGGPPQPGLQQPKQPPMGGPGWQLPNQQQQANYASPQRGYGIPGPQQPPQQMQQPGGYGMSPAASGMPGWDMAQQQTQPPQQMQGPGTFGGGMDQMHPAVQAFHSMIDHPHGQAILQSRGWTPPQTPQQGLPMEQAQQMQQPKTPTVPNPGLPTRR